MIKVLSIDDHKLFYEGLKAVLEREKDIVLAQGYQEDKAITDIVSFLKPDIILLDMYLPNKSGITIAKEIKHTNPDIKIIILSFEVNGAFIPELREIGVAAYISKGISVDELPTIIRNVYVGENIFEESRIVSESVRKVLTNDFGFTSRELEIYEWIRQGKSSQEIADMLNRSVMTIMTHRKNIRQKLKMKSKPDDSSLSNGGLSRFFEDI